MTPGKGGQLFEGKVPVFNTVAEAVAATGANTSVVYVPPTAAASALFEAADAGISAHRLHHRGHSGAGHGPRDAATSRARGARLIGPNCPGLITPGEAKVGHHPGQHLPAGPRGHRVAGAAR